MEDDGTRSASECQGSVREAAGDVFSVYFGGKAQFLGEAAGASVGIYEVQPVFGAGP